MVFYLIILGKQTFHVYSYYQLTKYVLLQLELQNVSDHTCTVYGGWTQ